MSTAWTRPIAPEQEPRPNRSGLTISIADGESPGTSTAVQAYEAAQKLHSQWGGGIYQLTADLPEPEPDEELSRLELAALAEVRDMVDRRAPAYLELAAPQALADPATPQAPPPAIKFDPWGHTMRGQHNRMHTLGYLRQHRQVTDAAAAVGRKAELAARGISTTDLAEQVFVFSGGSTTRKHAPRPCWSWQAWTRTSWPRWA
jgi:hypothetical protein